MASHLPFYTQIFPKVTKCVFKTYGPSGSIQIYDAMCILPVNILNEKIFIFLWFWFAILASATGIAVIFRIISLVSPKFRLYLFKRQVGKGNMDNRRVDVVFRRCNVILLI